MERALKVRKIAQFLILRLKKLFSAPYGWDSNSPCIFLRLNKIIDWLPIGYLSPPENTFYAEDGPRNTIERDAIYFRCKSFKPDDQNLHDEFSMV